MTPLNRKILAIIYVSLKKYGKKPRFLVVKDAEEGDWTFISGTCEHGETYQKCAIREIYEETKGLISMKSLPKRTKRFQTIDQDKRVDVMFIPLRLTGEAMKIMVAEFPNRETYERPELEENTDMRFETMGQFLRRKNVWDFVRDLCNNNMFLETCPK